MQPTTGYAVLDGQRIAYQVIGDGPVDLVVAPSWFSAFDMEWEEPRIRLFLERLSSFARVIRFDRRGSGASDPVDLGSLPPWESYAEDIACVMREVGSEKAVLYSDGDTGPLALLFAATHPELVTGLILFSTTARFLEGEDYPMGFPREFVDGIADEIASDWGTGEQLALYVPSRADDVDFQRWMGRLMRSVTTPSAVRSFMDGVITADVRHVLPSINVPALVLHPVSTQVPPIGQGRYLADHLSDSTLVELEGPGDAYPYFALADQILPEMRRFLTGNRGPAPTERTLATVLFTDIVESTKRATEVGDERWRTLLDLHDRTVERQLRAHSGNLVKNTGDGILATFEGPGRALQFAQVLRSELSRLGLPIRTGLHTGEIEVRGDDIGGLAVHIGARIMAAADADEVLVSRTVKDLVIGSNVQFEDRGTHTLKGIDDRWRLFAVTRG